MKKIVFLAAAAALATSPAIAANSVGSLSGSSSMSDFNVTTTIPKMVQISGLTDLSWNPSVGDLTNVNGAHDMPEAFCVYSNDTVDGLYKVQIDGDKSDPADYNTGEAKFAVSNGTSKLGIGVWVADSLNYYAGSNAIPGTAYAKKTTAGGVARPTTTNCGGVNNASLYVRMWNKRILAATAGTYTGTLKVTVSVQ
jgi:spore coat protein U-like protein